MVIFGASFRLIRPSKNKTDSLQTSESELRANYDTLTSAKMRA